MSEHALFSPSAAHRWMECPGSFAYPGNTEDGESSVYADDGTASHHWAAKALKAGHTSAVAFIGETLDLNGKTYTLDEERADFIQDYIDVVNGASAGISLRLVEHWVDTSQWLGEGQGGTVDFGAISAHNIIVCDLKYGMGERVDAFYVKDGVTYPNQQLALYAAGLLVDARLLGYEPNSFTLIVSQPRLGHVSSETFTREDIVAMAVRAQRATLAAGQALIMSPEAALEAGLMNPGDKTCRWCRAKAQCPALAKKVADEVRMEFDMIEDAPKPVIPDLGQAMRSVPLIEQWCEAVRTAAFLAVSNGETVIGNDGKPMKLVEGKMGNRKWIDEAAAEAALVAVLGPKAYEPQTVITAPAAAKLLDKKKTAAMWEAIQTNITRAPAKPVLAEGSDERAPYTDGVREEFEDIT